MSALNFPNSPTNGQVYSVGSRSWIYNSSLGVWEGGSLAITKELLGVTGTNTGDETAASIKTKLGITTLSGSNTGDQDLSGLVPYTGATGAVNLGTQSLSASTITSNGNTVATVVDPVRTTLSGNGTETTFAIGGASGLINPSALIVAIDGALQEPVVDYTVSGGSITFTSPLPNGSKAVVISPTNTLQVSQMIPADGSVTSSKLDNNITVSGNLVANGTANRLPNQLAITSDAVMTRDLIDQRFIISEIVNNVTINNSTTATPTGLSLTLPAGKWELNGFFYMTNVSSTAGSRIYISVDGAQPESYLHRFKFNSGSFGGNTTIQQYNTPSFGGGINPFVLSHTIVNSTAPYFNLQPTYINLTAQATITILFSQNSAEPNNTVFLNISRIYANRLSY